MTLVIVVGVASRIACAPVSCISSYPVAVSTAHASFNKIPLVVVIVVAGDTPLMLAVESELAAAVRLLIKEGDADVNRASETTGE